MKKLVKKSKEVIHAESCNGAGEVCWCILTFLSESNLIEGVNDNQSLDDSVAAYRYLTQQQEITNEVILKTHKILMKHQKKIKLKEKGAYRTIEVAVGIWKIVGITPDGLGLMKEWRKTGEVLKSKLVQKHIDKWIKWLNRLVTKIPDVDIWVLEARVKKDHIDFEGIHPFVDGNGRVGRLLMLWERIQLGLPVEIIYDVDKQEYYLWFKKG